jgi:hypothetical protein
MNAEWHKQYRASQRRWVNGLVALVTAPAVIYLGCAWWLLWLDWVDDTGSGPAGPTSGERSGPHQQAKNPPAYWINEDIGHGPA